MRFCLFFFVFSLFFSCSFVVFGQEVQMVPGMEDYDSPSSFVNDNDTLYFKTYSGIFKYDGGKVDSIAPLLSVTSDLQYTIFQNKIYFSDKANANYDNPTGLYEVSKEGGQIKKINEFDTYEDIIRLFEFNGKLLVVTNNQIHEFDGDSVKQIFDKQVRFSVYDQLTVYRNKLIFNNENKLYEYDGKSVRLLHSGWNSAHLRDHVVLNGTYFFYSNIVSGDDLFLYRYDGNIVRKIFELDEIRNIRDWTVFKNKLHFIGVRQSGQYNESLYTFDGVNYPAVVPSVEIDSSEASFHIATTFNNKLILRGTYHILEFDGVNAPKKIATNLLSVYVPNWFYDYGDRLVFTVNSSKAPQDTIFQLSEPWYLDKWGSAHLIEDIVPGPNGSWPERMFSFKNVLYFVALTEGKMRLWRYRPCKSTRSDVYVESCIPVLSPSGNTTYTESGLYSDTIPDAYGCDSTVVTHLSITEINKTIGFSGNYLISNENNGSNYRWLDCDDNLKELANGPSNRLAVSKTGSYAVEITKYGCTDRSDCKTVTFVGVDENKNYPQLTIYPNPSDGTLFVFVEETGEAQFEIQDVAGKQISFDLEKMGDTYRISMNQVADGIYILKYYSSESQRIQTKKMFVRSR